MKLLIITADISVTNDTMELSDCRDKWFFDEKYQCWCLEDVLYSPKADVPAFQRLSVYAPKAYMNPDGTVDTLPGFSSKTEQEGTYSFKKNKLTLTFQDGSTMEMQFKGGAFVCEQLHGDEPCLFTLRTVLRAD